MKKGLRAFMMALLALAICMSMTAPVAYAAKKDTDLEIPVSIKMLGEVLPASDEVTAKIVPLTEGAPAVKETNITIECLGAKGEGNGAFVIPAENLKLGIYKYQATIFGGSYYLADYGEEVTYTITVQILNNASYTDFDIIVFAQKQGDTSGAKPEVLVDENTYYAPMSVTVVKKWVDQDSSRPASIQVRLLCNGNEVDTMTLNKDNEWQGAWGDLDPRDKWTVEEVKVPSGYTVSYKTTEDGAGNKVVTVTNTGSLLQTGQLNWPIPVLCVAGLAMIVLGFLMMRKRQDENA